MNTRRIVSMASWGLLLLGASACSGDNEIPRVTIENGLPGYCLVEASFLNYHFTHPPIGPDGVMEAREVVPGTDYAYAVAVKPKSGEDCFAAANREGGDLYMTNNKQTVAQGDLLHIRFDAQNAKPVPLNCGDNTYNKGLALFERLAVNCQN